jgi:hypothetical protein
LRNKSYSRQVLILFSHANPGIPSLVCDLGRIEKNKNPPEADKRRKKVENLRGDREQILLLMRKYRRHAQTPSGQRLKIEKCFANVPSTRSPTRLPLNINLW